MWQAQNRPIALVFVSLLLATTVARQSDAKSKSDKPTIQPAGAQLVVESGKSEALKASSPGATRFAWKLGGKGTLSSTSGETVLYTAPDQAGEVALVTVVAYNQDVASEPSSISIRVSALPAVRIEKVGIPAAWMTKKGRNPATVIQMGNSPNGCHTGNDCFRVHYTAGADWAAVLWWPAKCGESGTPEAFRNARACSSCAVNVLQAGHLRSIHRATFCARGEHGGEVIEFKVGTDDICPTSGNSSTETLTTEWKEYDLDLTGVDLTKAVALFTWVATDLHNPHGATFYLDDVQFEGDR